MISQIRIQNFQSHKETVLDLYEGVNALVGVTGAGKSVVFKAVDWLFRNRPLGDEYRSWWGEDTKVEIFLSEGFEVGRVRTDSDNYYYIVDVQTADKKEFRAFGNGPPPQPVLDLLNLSEVNFQAQADPSFLISNSSGEVARYLNRAAHLDVIDQALTNIASVLRREKEELNQAKRELDEAREKSLRYDWLPGADEKLTELEKVQENILRLNEEGIDVETIVKEYEQAAGVLVAVQGILVFSPEVDRLIFLHAQIEKKNQEWEKLATVVDQYEKAGKELSGLIPLEGVGLEVERLLEIHYVSSKDRERVSGLRAVVHLHESTTEELGLYDYLSKLQEEWVRLDVLCSDVCRVRKDGGALKEIVGEIEDTVDSIVLADGELDRLRKAFDRLMPNICPLCDGTGGKK